MDTHIPVDFEGMVLVLLLLLLLSNRKTRGKRNECWDHTSVQYPTTTSILKRCLVGKSGKFHFWFCSKSITEPEEAQMETQKRQVRHRPFRCFSMIRIIRTSRGKRPVTQASCLVFLAAQVSNLCQLRIYHIPSGGSVTRWYFRILHGSRPATLCIAALHHGSARTRKSWAILMSPRSRAMLLLTIILIFTSPFSTQMVARHLRHSGTKSIGGLGE
mmetsp:Transcript_52845/g.72137  ORF Transcript_52845/g.72137 Transcript_52845/m.72137 type:complete len:216 (+) Transcript_52845:197-844(+)